MTAMGPIPTPQVHVTFTGIERSAARQAAQLVMASLEQETAIVDPVVSARPAEGELDISFELAAVAGDLITEVGGAMTSLRQALDRACDEGLAAAALASPTRFELSRLS